MDVKLTPLVVVEIGDREAILSLSQARRLGRRLLSFELPVGAKRENERQPRSVASATR